MNNARKKMQRVVNAFRNAVRTNNQVKFDVDYANQIEGWAREAYQEESVSWWHGFWTGSLLILFSGIAVKVIEVLT